jgi:hypothetical protein
VQERALVAKCDQVEGDLYEYWKQRSRLQWQEMGDRNIHFFHTIATQRRRRKHIVAVHCENGLEARTEKEINAEFVRYFK